MAGWRVGQLSGNAENIQAVLKVKSNMDSGMTDSAGGDRSAQCAVFLVY